MNGADQEEERVGGALNVRMDALRTERTPFVRATVVRVQQPNSAHPGDAAIVHADGSIEGFIGGQCAEGSVRTAALAALARDESVLLRVLPGDGVTFPEAPGAQVVRNPCLSGGALEIFLEPQLPPARLVVVGRGPIARALRTLGEPLGYLVEIADDARAATGAAALVVASLGGPEVEALRAALDAGVPYVGLVASPRRALGVLADLAPTEPERDRLHSPVGLDIGARTAAEIALSILAALVRERSRGTGAWSATPAHDPAPTGRCCP